MSDKVRTVGSLLLCTGLGVMVGADIPDTVTGLGIGALIGLLGVVFVFVAMFLTNRESE